MAAITKTNMRKLAGIMARRRSTLMPAVSADELLDDLVKAFSQEIVAAVDEPEFVRRCNGTLR